MTWTRLARAVRRCAWGVALLAGPSVAGLGAQQPAVLRLVGPDDGVTVPVGWHRGYAAVPAGALERLGWRVAEDSAGVTATRGETRIVLRDRSPFVRWDDRLLQLAQEPYRIGTQAWIPLQVIADFFPERRPREYRFEPVPLTVRALVADAWVSPAPAVPQTPVAAPAPAAPPAPRPSPLRVVVIDPGHGGEDPGASGPGGTREKDVALAIGLALARRLQERPDIEVHLTRDRDRLVPLWERGEWATGIKGDRPGVFLSIHANAGGDLGARGFETYFLSEARTEHERRVAALENAPFRVSTTGPSTDDPALDFILKDLGNLDHQHWSAHLAELVQEQFRAVHPGPDRGVKQGPLAVITNTLMPAVLIEVGFISNRAEERLLASEPFHEDAARAIADAVDAFFEVYPPGASAEARR